MEGHFPFMKLHKSSALSLSTDPSYVLQFATQVRSTSSIPTHLIAVGLSGNDEIRVYDSVSLSPVATFHGHTSTITSVRFDPVDENRIWSSSLDGSIRCWDLRCKPEDVLVQLRGEHEVVTEAFTAMDLNSAGHICCAGTELVDEVDVFIYLWDIRQLQAGTSCQLLAKYEESHSDDITQVVFHPESQYTLITGSTDGLISTFNASITAEEDALEQTLNTDSSVAKLGYFGPIGRFVYSITHTDVLQFWDPVDGVELGCIDEIRSKDKIGVKLDYLVDCIYHNKTERLFVVGGTNCGRIELLHASLDGIRPHQSLLYGHSTVVRNVCYFSESDMLYSGDEGGVICSWMPERKVSCEVKGSKGKESRSRTPSSKRPYEKRHSTKRPSKK